MKSNIAKGKIGEDIAAKYLEKRGFKIIEKNWRYSRYGEIDIIATDQKTLVFIEVKTRSTVNYGHPVESITKSKIDKIRTLAGAYLNENPDLKFKNYRFDAIGIILNKEPEIVYYKDIYQF
ncbi:MAG: YraN family protein [Candidatus Melainabacteria bacterium RIFOXYA12_FULL_32_12]|nr:MAG: YraN family protein [Candidatus Melainabacteria bacterium RIFOXYA2_FULL_32_9]OGI26780.1 MAG: YraN family protein [Candidatus Melainabacteria bacterium RIFOXYA12_FULL_32_12]